MTEASPPDRPTRLAAVVARAAGRARELGRPVLASVVTVAPAADPLGALAEVERLSPGDADIARLATEGRMFWAHRASGLALAGLGAAVTLSPLGTERFASADRAWRELLESAVVDRDDTSDDAASGPLLLGGFSFEPDGPRTALWDGFDATGLVVPSILVTSRGGRTLVTLSLLVQPGAGATADVARLDRLAQAITAAPQTAAAGHSSVHAEPASLEYADLLPSAEWLALVASAVEAIGAGAFRKVVLARAVAGEAPRAPGILTLLAVLRAMHRDAYVFARWAGDAVFLGASPERLVRLVGREVDASSLAGSAPRGATPEEDAALANALTRSEKDLAEHAMVRVALGDALGQLCDHVRSHDGPELLTLPHVHHLHTAVQATLREGESLLGLVGALHPTPAVGGTPRTAALAFIRAHEQLDRGWYASPIGWVGRDAGELAVGLRSALVDGATATLFAGCGVVAGSDPAQELAESRIKLRPMQSALAVTLAREPALASGGQG